ncbi:hypothetical protein HOY82DRAFT_591720 [Tuber indicum]|nr:hypothetical protein HOY82DRAFT_591720 [Tuber indicum]
MEITKESSPNQTAQLGIGKHSSARKSSFKSINPESGESSQGESKSFLDSIIQKNLRDFLAGQAAVSAAKAAPSKSATEAHLPVKDASVVGENFTGNRVENPNNILTRTGIGTSPEDMDSDQVIWDTDSTHGTQDSDGDIVLGDAPDHLLDKASDMENGSIQPTIVEHHDEGSQEPQSEENAHSFQSGMCGDGEGSEEGEIVVLKRAFCGSGDTSSGNMTDSPAHTNHHKTSYHEAYIAPSPAPDILPKRPLRRPASVCRLNIPRELSANLHRDPRFDQYCHAWINRPDFCGRGDECYYAHMYPPGTVEEFGITTLDIDSNGAILNGQDTGVELRESRWSRYLLPGREERTPGCYDRICKDFERNACRRGAECWYQHSTDPGAIRRRQGVFWRNRVDSKLEAIANSNGSFGRPYSRNNYSGQNRAVNNLNYYRSPIGRTGTSWSRSEEMNPAYNRQDSFNTGFRSVTNRDEEAAVASWNITADRNAREYAVQQERLRYLNQESQRRRTENISRWPTTSDTETIKSDVPKPKHPFFITNQEGTSSCPKENPLVKCDSNKPVDGQATEKTDGEVLISLL